LIVAAIFAAAMSTLSSSLNSSAAVAVADFYRPLRGGHSSESHDLRVARSLTLGWGIVQISVALVARTLSQRVVDEVLAIAAFTNGAILGVFFLGTFTRRVGESAALVGMAAGLLAMLYVKFFTPIAWPWFVVIGSATTVFVGLVSHMLGEVALRRAEVMRLERSRARRGRAL